MNWKDLKLNSVIFLITNALFFLIGIGTFSKISLKSTVISILISSCFSYFLLSLYLKKNEDCKLIQKNSIFIDTIKCVLLLILLNYTLNKTSAFITYNVVNSLSIYLVSTFFLIISVFIVKKGFPTITKSLFLYLLLDIFLIVITFVLLFPKMNFNNILPIIDTKYENICLSCLIYLCVSLTPFIYLPLFKEKLSQKRCKSIKKGFLTTHAFIFFYTLVVFSILGINLVNIYPYPEVAIFKKVSFLNIIDRVESIFSISYFLSLFIFFIINFYQLVNIIKKYFNIKKETKSLILLAFLIFISNEILEISVFGFLIVIFLLIICFFTTTKSKRC